MLNDLAYFLVSKITQVPNPAKAKSFTTRSSWIILVRDQLTVSYMRQVAYFKFFAEFQPKLC